MHLYIIDAAILIQVPTGSFGKPYICFSYGQYLKQQ